MQAGGSPKENSRKALLWRLFAVKNGKVSLPAHNEFGDSMRVKFL